MFCLSLKQNEDTKKESAYFGVCRLWYSITSKFNILAIGENWCIDSIINIPVVHWLEKNNENIKLKVIDTDSYSKFMPNEKVITPTFIIMNQEYQEIGKWIQYPERILDVVV